jgi:hypothetical protein
MTLIQDLGGALFSEDRIYRYRLWRRWSADKPIALFCMLNPSSAGEAFDDNDPTVRKCIGYATRWGCGGIDIVNLFALVSTDPKGLREFEGDVVGARNKFVWEDALYSVRYPENIVVAAWGVQKHPLKTEQALAFQRAALAAGQTIKCLGLSEITGEPLHPLMLSYQRPLMTLDWIRDTQAAP